MVDGCISGDDSHRLRLRLLLRCRINLTTHLNLRLCLLCGHSYCNLRPPLPPRAAFSPPIERRLGLKIVGKRKPLRDREQNSEVLEDTINALDFGTTISKPLMDEESEFTGPLFPQFQIRLTKDDFVQAMKWFLPIAMCDITKSASEEGHGGWQDVADLIEIRNSIKEMIELPSKFPMIFSHGPLRLRSNVLLYGPPGCDKTHIVGASAAACSLRFISVKGPVLLNKYIGASEQVVRDILSKAAATAPWLLFFGEFDSIAPKKGS
ncbi:hypothetical protein L2E82_16987 [Cichorium intybus]|uniref:Uncharacterized protein n=1 Tax=Cichorium intybus TaxID=13427 RepID=A0ACB9F808_CICIN|nr:hypothetical protein L2E82_16987 [Cichorium intybus]